jgi:hypothetical protein
MSTPIRHITEPKSSEFAEFSLNSPLIRVQLESPTKISKKPVLRIRTNLKITVDNSEQQNIFNQQIANIKAANS